MLQRQTNGLFQVAVDDWFSGDAAAMEQAESHIEQLIARAWSTQVSQALTPQRGSYLS